MIFARPSTPNDAGQGGSPPRRGPRFSLRTLFVLMTSIALVCGFYVWTLAQVRSREQLVETIRGRGIMVAVDLGSSKHPAHGRSPWLMPAAWFKPVRSISVEHGKLSSAELDMLQRAFPESNVSEATFY